MTTRPDVGSSLRSHSGFRRTPVVSSTGRVFSAREVVVPRIEQRLTDSVIFLYPRERDAREGRDWGGSGFLVGVYDWPRAGPHMVTVYGVSNSHVVANAPVIRLNVAGGATEIIPLSPYQWVHHPDGDDVAIAPLGTFPAGAGFVVVPDDAFISRSRLTDIEVGDDTVLIGRHIGADNRQANSPLARFGNLSLRDTQIIETDRGVPQESFLVEARSLTGYSGSPVFVQVRWEDTPSYRHWLAKQDGVARWGDGSHPPPPRREDRLFLLGVGYGHLPRREPVLTESNELHPENLHVKQNTGIMGVVPAWKLRELLDEGPVVVAREQDVQAARKIAADRNLAVTDSAERPYTTDDLLRDLRRVGRNTLSRSHEGDSRPSS